MSIGYTVNRKNEEALKGKCHMIVYADPLQHKPDDFYEFISENDDADIYIYELNDLGLQVGQLLRSCRLILTQGIRVHFLEKGELFFLSDQDYCVYLYEMAEIEHEIMAKRTREGLKESKKRGISAGRPKIDKKKIKKIQYLHMIENKTSREIARLCKVSVGTVYNYIRTISKEED